MENNNKNHKKQLSSEQSEELLNKLQSRFEQNMPRHEGLSWAEVQARLDANPEKLWSLQEMERTGGEPDVVGQDKETGEVIFMIAPQKALQAAEACVTTVRAGNLVKPISQREALWEWPTRWALAC